MARKKDDIEAGILQKGVSAVRTDGPPIGRPVRCALGRGALIAFASLLGHIKKMTYESRLTFRVFTV